MTDDATCSMAYCDRPASGQYTATMRKGDATYPQDHAVCYYHHLMEWHRRHESAVGMTILLLSGGLTLLVSEWLQLSGVAGGALMIGLWIAGIVVFTTLLLLPSVAFELVLRKTEWGYS